jgi:hypothetical protein
MLFENPPGGNLAVDTATCSIAFSITYSNHFFHQLICGLIARNCAGSIVREGQQGLVPEGL